MPVLGVNPNPYDVNYLMERTFDLLLGSARQQMNRLTAAIDATEGTFTLDFAPQAAQLGTYVAIDDEIMYVWSNNPTSSASTITVQRGVRGTTAVSHSAGSLIYVDPYFTRWQVRNTLRDEIRSWAPQVFAVQTLDVPSTNFVRGYDMGNLKNWLYVLQVTESPDTLWATPDTKDWTQVDFNVAHQANTTDFPSGNALFITDPRGVW